MRKRGIMSEASRTLSTTARRTAFGAFAVDSAQAAELFRRQVEQGLSGNSHESGKARIVLREWFCGRIDLTGEGETLLAEFGELPAAALMQVVGFKALGDSGSGGVLLEFPTAANSLTKQGASDLSAFPLKPSTPQFIGRFFGPAEKINITALDAYSSKSTNMRRGMAKCAAAF